MTIVDSTSIILKERPMIATSDAGLQDYLDYVEERILSRGGFDNLGEISQQYFLDEMNMILSEIANRN